MMASYEESNSLKPIMHEHDNLKGTRGGDWDRVPRTLSSNTIVIVMKVAAKHEQRKTIKNSHCPRQMKEQALAANSQKTYQRKNTFIYYKFYKIPISISIIIYIRIH